MLIKKKFNRLSVITLILLINSTSVYPVYAQEGRLKKWLERRHSRKQQEYTYPISNAAAENTNYQEENLVAEIVNILEEGGRVDWTSDNKTVFFDAPGEDGYYDLWSINIDGSDKQCLTCDKAELTSNHVGNPTLHPAGKYIIFQAVDSALAILPPILKIGAKQHSSPGAGINNNLWCMNLETGEVWQMTRISAGQGIIHPHFSKDGNKLIWAEKIDLGNDAWGNWAIKIADFKIQSSQPALNNIQTLKPGNFQQYEAHGFSPDGTKIIFSAFSSSDKSKTFDCYIFDLKTNELLNLTDSPYEWDEFASISPDGKKIAWVSTKGTNQELNRKGQIKKGKWKLDFWIMNIDGTDKKRLTHFNVKGFPEYDERGIVCADFSWGNDSKSIIAKVRVQSDEVMSGETIRLIKLK